MKPNAILKRVHAHQHAGNHHELCANEYLTDGEIAERLGISIIATVRKHMQNIVKRLELPYATASHHHMVETWERALT